jgi:hypothetical protein
MQPENTNQDLSVETAPVKNVAVKDPRTGRTARPRLRFAVDAVMGLAVFFALSAATLGPSAAASLLGIDPPAAVLTGGTTTVPLFVTNYANAFEQSGMNVKFLMLAAVFSALFALNNAFVRHLRKAHIRSHRRAKKVDRD